MDKASPTRGLAILKLDMEKVYDRVYWPFLFTILTQFRFRQRSIAWIRACIQNFNLALLINGTPLSEFRLLEAIIKDVHY